MMLRRIFGPMRDEGTGGWIKLRGAAPSVFLLSIIRIIKSTRMRWVGHVAQMGEKRNVYRLLVRKRPLGRPKCRWIDNIKINLVERMGWCGLDW
jgi:hypothetical protein